MYAYELGLPLGFLPEGENPPYRINCKKKHHTKIWVKTQIFYEYDLKKGLMVHEYDFPEREHDFFHPC